MGDLELRAIVMALVIFAPSLAGALILCFTDNREAEIAVNKRCGSSSPGARGQSLRDDPGPLSVPIVA
jgi:hypothetical protein